MRFSPSQINDFGCELLDVEEETFLRGSDVHSRNHVLGEEIASIEYLVYESARAFDPRSNYIEICESGFDVIVVWTTSVAC
jgi:hypothetical protein